MNTNTPNMLPLPQPLDITKYHSRAEVEAHRIKHEQVVAHNATTTRLMAEAETRKQSSQNAPLTKQQYEQEGYERHLANQARKVAAAAEKEATEKQKAEFLLSSPAVVDVLENNPHSLAITINHWLQVRGYSIDTNNINYFVEGMYALTLLAPEVKNTSKGAK